MTGDLPTSWRAALAVCPFCRGVEDHCTRCEGTGDLLGSMLVDAFRRGQENVMFHMVQVQKVREMANGRVREDAADPELQRRLRLAMGL